MTTTAESVQSVDPSHADFRRDSVFPSRRSRIRVFGQLVRRYPLGAVGGLMAIILLTMAVAPSLFLPLESQDPLHQSVRERLQGPSGEHWFGQDELGRDLYARLVVATRTSITIGFGVVVLQQVLSISIGTVSAYFGGKFDLIFQRLIDIGIAVPNLVFIILIVQTLSARLNSVAFGHGDVFAIVLGVGFVISAGASRTIRGVALSLTSQQFVESARAQGATDLRVMARHIIPNLLPIAITSATILIGSAVLIESSLSFLGYGIQPPTPSWGRMLADGRSQLIRAPHLAIFPGLMIFITVFSFNMLGDALRDKLDPRLRGTN